MSPKAKAKLVIDASVTLKWQLDDEECVTQAVALRDDSLRRQVEMCAPTLLLYEAINGLVVAFRRGRLLSAEVPKAISDLLVMGIIMRMPDPQQVAALALAYEIAAYDSAYLALAKQEGCELWTGDLALYRMVGEKLGWVRWIGDYPTPSRE